MDYEQVLQKEEGDDMLNTGKSVSMCKVARVFKKACAHSHMRHGTFTVLPATIPLMKGSQDLLSTEQALGKNI